MDKASHHIQVDSSKFVAVMQWLHSVYGAKAVPSFEITPDTVEHLYDFRSRNLTRNMQTQLAIEDLHQRTLEYTSESNRIEHILEQIGVPISSLSKRGSSQLECLTEIASSLAIKDVSTSCFLSGLSTLIEDMQETADRLDEQTEESKALMLITRQSLAQLNDIKTVKQRVQEERKQKEEDIKSQRLDYAHASAKAKQSTKQLEVSMLAMRRLQLDKSCTHEGLVNQQNRINQAQEALKPLTSKLDAYSELPPDHSLAQVIVEEARQKLQRLDRQFAEGIAAMQVEVDGELRL